MNFPNMAKSIPVQLNTIAQNKTLKEFTVLCSASISVFFFGLTIVLLRATPIEEQETVVIRESVKETDRSQEIPQSSKEVLDCG